MAERKWSARDGLSASEVKREADVWPKVINEITENGDVIGILFKAAVNKFKLRRGFLYLHAAQFDKLIRNMTPSMQITFTYKSAMSALTPNSGPEANIARGPRRPGSDSCAAAKQHSLFDHLVGAGDVDANVDHRPRSNPAIFILTVPASKIARSV